IRCYMCTTQHSLLFLHRLPNHPDLHSFPTRRSSDLWERFDYMIALDDQNIKDLHRIQKQTDDIEIVKLLDFVKDSPVHNVPDPYFTGDFIENYALVSVGCNKIMQHVIKKNYL